MQTSCAMFAERCIITAMADRQVLHVYSPLMMMTELNWEWDGYNADRLIFSSHRVRFVQRPAAHLHSLDSQLVYSVSLTITIN